MNNMDIKPNWAFYLIPIMILIIGFSMFMSTIGTIAYQQVYATRPVGFRFSGENIIHVAKKKTVYIMSSLQMVENDPVVRIKDNEYQVNFINDERMTVNVTKIGDSAGVYEIVIPDSGYVYEKYKTCFGYVLEPGNYNFTFGGNYSFLVDIYTLIYDFDSSQAAHQMVVTMNIFLILDFLGLGTFAVIIIKRDRYKRQLHQNKTTADDLHPKTLN